VEILDEVLAGTKKEDPLLAWMTDYKDVLRLEDPTIVNEVVTEGYAPDLTDDDLEEIGRHPFVIAYALTRPNEYPTYAIRSAYPTRTPSKEEIRLIASALEPLGRLVKRHFGEAGWLVLGAVALKRSAPFTGVCPLRSLTDTPT